MIDKALLAKCVGKQCLLRRSGSGDLIIQGALRFVRKTRCKVEVNFFGGQKDEV